MSEGQNPTPYYPIKQYTLPHIEIIGHYIYPIVIIILLMNLQRSTIYCLPNVKRLACSSWELRPKTFLQFCKLLARYFQLFYSVKEYVHSHKPAINRGPLTIRLGHDADG